MTKAIDNCASRVFRHCLNLENYYHFDLLWLMSYLHTWLKTDSWRFSFQPIHQFYGLLLMMQPTIKVIYIYIDIYISRFSHLITSYMYTYIYIYIYREREREIWRHIRSNYVRKTEYYEQIKMLRRERERERER